MTETENDVGGNLSCCGRGTEQKLRIWRKHGGTAPLGGHEMEQNLKLGGSVTDAWWNDPLRWTRDLINLRFGGSVTERYPALSLSIQNKIDPTLSCPFLISLEEPVVKDWNNRDFILILF